MFTTDIMFVNFYYGIHTGTVHYLHHFLYDLLILIFLHDVDVLDDCKMTK